MLPETARHLAALADYARNPQQCPPPPGIDAARAAVYARLLRNNVQGFVRRCFSASLAVADAAVWADLEQDFLARAQPQSPYFTDIAPQFLAYARHSGRLPENLVALMDFEAAQLAVEIAPLAHGCSRWQADTVLAWSPAAQRRDYAVNFIDSNLQDFAAGETAALVWRHRDDDAVYYCRLDEAERHLLDYFVTRPASAAQLLAELGGVMGDDGGVWPWLQRHIGHWVAAGVLQPQKAEI